MLHKLKFVNTTKDYRKRLNLNLTFSQYDEKLTKFGVNGTDALVLNPCLISESSSDKNFVG